MRLYLAGPMRGYPDNNASGFTDAAARLRDNGYIVWSPHENELPLSDDPARGEGAELRHFLALDLPAVLDSDAVAVLNGWQASVGAQVETYTAFACAIPVHEYDQATGGLGDRVHRYEHPHISRQPY